MANFFKKTQMNMTEGNLFKKILVYSIPLILTGELQLLYSACDLVVCGSFGSPHAVGAISATNALINLIIQLLIGLSIGANVLMARCYGANDNEKAKKVMYTSMIFATVFGIIIGIIGAFISSPILKLMGTPSEFIDLSIDYLFIYFLGLVFSMIFNFGSSLLRAIGDSFRPFIALAISGVLNIGLNFLFVIPFKMDVSGVALATIISQAFSAFLVMIFLIKNKGFVCFKFKEIRFYKNEAIEIIKIGLPAGIQGAIFSLSNVLIQSSINSLGANVADGNGAAVSLEGFMYTCINAIGQANVAFISANYGAKNIKNIKKCMLYSFSLITIFSVLFGLALFLFRYPLVSIYINPGSENASIKTEAAVTRLIIFASTYVLCGYMDNMAQSLRGIGYSTTPAIISLIGSCALRIVYIYTLFTIPELHNLASLCISYPISWVITLLGHFVAFMIVKKKAYNKCLENN